MRTISTLLVVMTVVAASPAQSLVAVRGEIVHTMSGPPLENALVLIRDGKIVSVTPDAPDSAIPEGSKVLEARVVTPGLIDAHTVVGLAGQFNQRHDQEQIDRTAAIQPDIRALDAYNPNERLVAWLRRFGITTINTGPAPMALVPGVSMIAKTTGDVVEDCAVAPAAMLLVTLSDGGRAPSGKSPGTHGKMIAALRAKLIAAREYAEKRNGDAANRPPRDLALDVLADALARKRRVLVTAHRVRDIAAALRIADEFDLDLVLDGAAEVYRILDRVKARGIPVIIHPPMARARGDLENASMTTAAKLAEAGIPFCFQSGYESYVPKTRVVLFEAAIAVSRGLDFEKALAALTIDAARILGVADRVGSLEPGKDADLALFDGDPFEYTSHCTGVVIGGRVAND